MSPPPSKSQLQQPLLGGRELASLLVGRQPQREVDFLQTAHHRTVTRPHLQVAAWAQVDRRS